MKKRPSIPGKIAALFLILLVALGTLFGCENDDGALGTGQTESVEQTEDVSDASLDESETQETRSETTAIDENGVYTTKEDVALYLHTYGVLPSNFMTKKEARQLGWSGGGLDDYADGMCIGGDSFGNYEGVLPDRAGIKYHECDINTLHADSRGAERLVYSTDGYIYYTSDHYESFELLYEGEG